MALPAWGLTLAFMAGAQPKPLVCRHFTVDNGLSQNMVYCMAQDQQGFLWIGTKGGLNRYDGCQMRGYFHSPFDSSSLSDNQITALLAADGGRLWVGTGQGSLDLYDPASDRFMRVLPADTLAPGCHVTGIAEDSHGRIWVGTFGNGLYGLPPARPGGRPESAGIRHYRRRAGEAGSLAHNVITALWAGQGDTLWVALGDSSLQYALLAGGPLYFRDPPKAAPRTFQAGPGLIRCFYRDEAGRLWMGGDRGLFLRNGRRKTWQPYSPEGGVRVPGVLSMSAGPPGPGGAATLWLGTADGLFILDADRGQLRAVDVSEGGSPVAAGCRFLSLARDRSGCMWLGSNGYGLSQYDFHRALFSLPPYRSADGRLGVADLSVRSFLERGERLLIGTTDNLWVADRLTRRMKRVGLYDRPNHYNLIYSMVGAAGGAVWLAGNEGLIWYDPESGASRRYLPQLTGDGHTDNRVFKLYMDAGGTLWALTPYTFSRFDTATHRFTHYRFSDRPVNDESEPGYGDIYPDGRGNFWLATGEGLLFFDSHRKGFRRYVNRPWDSSSLSFDRVRCLQPDPRHPDRYLWIGTAGGGLNRLDLSTGIFKHYTVDDGLPNNVIYGILPDTGYGLWISTNRGLARFNPAAGTFLCYDASNGLQSDEFNSGAFYRGPSGKCYFGGIQGFNVFYPSGIRMDTAVPPLVFTDFRLFNRSASLHQPGSPLVKSLASGQRIVLPYRDNVIGFEVAALDFVDPARNQYAYRLEGLSEDWIMMGSECLITLSNLHPGRYQLRIKAANSDGIWNEQGLLIDLIITPPWWKSWWAFLLYAVLVAMAVLWLRRSEIHRLRLRNSLALEHMNARKLEELHRVKSRFFTNISHEFRLPLTLILGPLEDLIRGGDMARFQGRVPELHRQAAHLLQLVNQLLDLSRLDAGSYPIRAGRQDLLSFVQQCMASFEGLARRDDIALACEVDAALEEALRRKSILFYFDGDIMEKILTNLLSNAVKYTPRGGSVTLRLAQAGQALEITVSDTGTGIPADQLPYIFNRFYQIEEAASGSRGGSGIGLALVLDLVTLLGGEVTAESTVGEGSVFCCRLPIGGKRQEAKEDKALSLRRRPIAPPDEAVDRERPAAEKGAPAVLIAEDHEGVRRYIRECLQDEYAVTEAADGAEALVLARGGTPDLVVVDIMMPVMDGLTLCRALKTDEQTSHIPVIILTARAQRDDRLHGLSTGADAYLLKPFHAEELRMTAANLIASRNRMRAKFSGRVTLRPSEVSAISRDRQFLQGLLDAVETHMGDESFSVDQLGREVGMSVSQINRRLKATTGQTALQLIRSVRMQRAMALLRHDQATIAEVAYQTGFEDPGYFTKVFKQYYGCLPSEREKFPSKG